MTLSVLSLLAFAAAAIAAPNNLVSVSYDKTFDDKTTKLATLACSDGENGLLQYNYTTLGVVPNFPNVAGIPAIQGWGSENCASCWKVTYKSRSVNVLGVDVGQGGVNMALATMNKLTNNMAENLGRIQATLEKVDAGDCGFKP
ncbi:hypothetical protein KEM52_004380 [Ascosphaera acerosa]|nr:hypothetical protein KEM52_004380 [Ascosphaera acerosa]